MELGDTRHCVLILLLIYQIRTLQGQCAVNFPSQEDVVVTSAETSDETVDTHFLFPSINFTCSTLVTGWIMAAQATGRNNQEFPEIQTWRITALSYTLQSYVRITTTANINTTVTMLVSPPGLYQYTYSTPIEVSAGDLLALRIPPEDSTDIRPLFNTSSIRTVDEYIINPYNPSLELIGLLMPSFGDMYYPLIAPILEAVPRSSSESLSTTMVSISTSTMSIPIATNTPTITTTLRTNTPSTVSSSIPSNPSLMPTFSSTTDTITTRQPSLPVQTQPSSSSISIPSASQPSVTNPAISTTTGIPPGIRPFPSTIIPQEPSSTVFSSVGGSSDNDPLPISIVAGSVIAAVLLFIVIIILVVVLLVMLVLFDKREKGKAEMSPQPPNGGNEAIQYDNTSFIAITYDANVSYGQVNHHYMSPSSGGGVIPDDKNETEQIQQTIVKNTINVEVNTSYGHVNHHYMSASPGARIITDDMIYDGIVEDEVDNDQHIHDNN